MSWERFKAAMSVVDGPQNADVTHFSRTLATEYHLTMQSHFDLASGGGKVVNLDGRDEILYEGLLAANMANRSIATPINWLQTMGGAFTAYWAGTVIVGPLGTVSILDSGACVTVNLKPHTNYQLVVDALELSLKIHIMTLIGQLITVTTPPSIVPWSGSSLQCPA